MNETTLAQIKFEGEEIYYWNKIILSSEWIIIFYKLYDERENSGFKFLSLKITGRQIDLDLDDKDNNVEVLYRGYAYFDGIRHMYLGDEITDNYGYINYPNVTKHIKILEKLRELELKHCRLD